jgi:hypothetical protein
MEGVRLDDVRRALEARDPGLTDLVVALGGAAIEAPSGPVPDDALTYQKFVSELSSWRFQYKSDEEKEHYRRSSWAILEGDEAVVALPDRLKLHEVIMELWEDDGPYARETLLAIIARCPLKWGPWRALKRIFKEAEAKGDTEVMGALAARVDMELSGYAFYSEVSRGTLIYMVRRAWRYLRRLGQGFPAAYPDAAVDFLRFYTNETSWNRTWVANHIFFHEGKRYGTSSFRFWRAPTDLLAQRAFGEAWTRTPRPLFALLERAQSEQARRFAISALKQDFRTVLREVEASWVARLAANKSESTHDFIIWLLGSVPKFEQASFRDMGLHEAVLGLLDSPSNGARTYAAKYARTHARDMELGEIIRLMNNRSKDVRELALDLLGALDPRSEVGLDAWGSLLGTAHGHEVAVGALTKHFGAKELTPAWFRERLLSEVSGVVGFARENVTKVHAVGALGAGYFTGLFDEDGLTQDAASWALGVLIASFDAKQIGEEFWRRSLLHPLTSWRVRSLIESEKVKAADFGVGFWRSLAFHVTFESDPWITALKESGRAWAAKLTFDEGLATFARGMLGDVRQFAPSEIGHAWLMSLVDRMEATYHDWAVGYMLKALVPADFAPESGDEDASASAAGAPVDLGGATFLFTGKLATMTRKQATGKVDGAGGKNAKSVTATLDYLVVGDEGSPLFGGGKKGSKMVKAEKLQGEGSAVKIISETAFLQMLTQGVKESSGEDALAGSEVLWEMATGEGEEDAPRRAFAIRYIRRHHEDIAPGLTDRSVDPGAEIPREFFTFERVEPLFGESRRKLRRLALEIGRWELARWSPSLAEIVGLCELEHRDVTEFFEGAFMAPDIKENAAYRLGREALDADGVYRFCESLDKGTRRIGMALIAKYPDLAEPSELFKLTESPDRQVRAFVVRTLWSLYRDKGVTETWEPTPIEVTFPQAKTKKGLKDFETGPGVTPAPDEAPATPETMAGFMRRVLYGIPPTKLSREDAQAVEGEAEGEEEATQRRKRARPIPARKAKLHLIEVVRDMAVEDEELAAQVWPLIREFMESRGRSERDACLVALTRIGAAHPDLDVWREEV